jgi:hypothetical protein
MAGRDLRHLADNFPDTLAAVLWGLGVTASAIQHELEATQPTVVAKTNSRSHVGTLNDFIGLLRWRLDGDRGPDLAQVALELSSTPVAASTPRALFPDQLTRQLLEG